MWKFKILISFFSTKNINLANLDFFHGKQAQQIPLVNILFDQPQLVEFDFFFLQWITLFRLENHVDIFKLLKLFETVAYKIAMQNHMTFKKQKCQMLISYKYCYIAVSTLNTHKLICSQTRL